VPTLEVHADGRKALAETVNDVEDERVIGDDLAQVKSPRASAMDLNLWQ